MGASCNPTILANVVPIYHQFINVIWFVAGGWIKIYYCYYLLLSRWKVFFWKAICTCVSKRTRRATSLPYLLLFFIFIKMIFLFCNYIFSLLWLCVAEVYAIAALRIAHCALTNLETLRNYVLRTTIIKLWNCVLRTWKTCCAAHLWKWALHVQDVSELGYLFHDSPVCI